MTLRFTFVSHIPILVYNEAIRYAGTLIECYDDMILSLSLHIMHSTVFEHVRCIEIHLVGSSAWSDV